MASRDAVGRAVYETAVDPSGLKKGLGDADRAIKATGAQMETAFARTGTGALGRLGASVDGLVGKFNRVAQGGGIGGAILGGVGLGAGLGAFNLVSGAITGVMDKMGQSLDLASDKAEAASKANVLFGGSYGIIEKASKSAATTVGLSSGAYLEAAGNLGNLITNFGITGDAGAKMAKSMVQLAADMGSFNNASTEEVTQAMGSAFVGETEPIRRFGVMLSAAAVAAKAVQLGLAKNTNQVSQSAKVQATYALILEQTSKAQGDFARTSDGKANADRIRAAQSEEALTKLGEVITPLYQKAMPLLATAMTSVIDVIAKLGGAVSPLVDIALGSITKAIEGIGQAFQALEDMIDPGAAEWDEFTRAIIERSKAIGLDGDAVVAYTEKIKQQKIAEQERASLATEIADIDQQITDATLDTAMAVAELTKAKNEAIDKAVYENEIALKNKQLQIELAPLLAQREALTGELADADERRAEATTASAKADAYAAEAIAAYNELLARTQREQAGVEAMYPPLDKAVTGSAQVFSRAASQQNLAMGSVVLAVVETGKAFQDLDDETRSTAIHFDTSVSSMRAAVKRTLNAMNGTLADAMDPWKQAWRDLARYAKDPFSPQNFENRMDRFARRAVEKAEEAAKDGKPKVAARWRALADAAKDPVVRAMTLIGLSVEDALTALAGVRRAGAEVASFLDFSDLFNLGQPRDPDRNAAGTAHYRGGWTWVGERGPELMRLPAGTAIQSNEESMRSTSRQDVYHHISADGAANLRSAGFSSEDVGQILASANRQAGLRFTTPRRV